MNKDLSEHFKDLVLNTRTPLVARKVFPPWNIFKGSLVEWCENLDQHLNEAVCYEQMPVENGATPQWERRRKIVTMKAKEFLEKHAQVEQNYWTGLNYKRGFELTEECVGDIDFSVFGFPNKDKDFSFWLSSKCANTPCHYDTYGCNVVVQVFGEKSWLLFPPDAPLTTSRIPFEESSVYCTENFYSPDPNDLQSYQKLNTYARRAVLQAGDVLIVPPQWWHYVETVETALSVNYWVPLSTDVDKQIDECIAKYLIESLVQGSPLKDKEYILNPNQLYEEMQRSDLLQILKYLLDAKFGKTEIQQNYYPSFEKSAKQIEDLVETLSAHIEPVKVLSAEELDHLLTTNSKRFKAEGPAVSPLLPIHEALISSVLCPITINSIKKDLLQRYQPGNNK